VRQGGVITQTIAGLFHRARDCGGSPRARAIHQAMAPWVGKAVAPCAEGSIGEVQRLSDRVEALPWDDGAHGVGTVKAPGLFRRFSAGIACGQGIIGNVQCEGAHADGLHNTLRQKFKNST
jgi:hypothetical protein